MKNSLKIWERRVQNSKVGGIECMRNIFGKILMVETGK